MSQRGRDARTYWRNWRQFALPLKALGVLVLHNFMHFCFTRREGDKETADINSLARALAIWARVHMEE